MPDLPLQGRWARRDDPAPRCPRARVLLDRPGRVHTNRHRRARPQPRLDHRCRLLPARVRRHQPRRKPASTKPARATSTRSRGWAAALWTAALILAFLPLLGLPPRSGFVGKLEVFTAAIDAGQAWLAVFGILVTVASLYQLFGDQENLARWIKLLPPDLPHRPSRPHRHRRRPPAAPDRCSPARLQPHDRHRRLRPRRQAAAQPRPRLDTADHAPSTLAIRYSPPPIPDRRGPGRHASVIDITRSLHLAALWLLTGVSRS